MMWSRQPSDKGLGEEGGWAFRVSDSTSALCGGAGSSLFQGIGWVTARGGTHGDPLFHFCSTSAHSSASSLVPCAEVRRVAQQKVPYQQHDRGS